MIILLKLFKPLHMLIQARRYHVLVLIEAYFLLSKYHFLIMRKDYSHWRHQLDTKRHDSTPETARCSIEAVKTSKRLNRHILAVVRHHRIHMNCLRRCLALKAMIERRKGVCALHIGVKIARDGNLSAHSWLTVNGELINDSVKIVSQYTEITHCDGFFTTAHFD